MDREATLALAGHGGSLPSEEPFPAPLRTAFLARARSLSVRQGQVIVAEGTESRDVYLIQSGRVQISLLSPSGREVILRDMLPHYLFGELAAIDRLPRSASVVVKEASLLAQMTGDEFLDFLGEVPRAGLWMAQQLAARVRDLTEKAFAFATLPVAGRVHAELLRMAASCAVPNGSQAVVTGDSVTFTRAPTHAELAARIGTHREAVSRELGQLAAEGLVRQQGRTLTILSLKRLRQLNSRFQK